MDAMVGSSEITEVSDSWQLPRMLPRAHRKMVKKAAGAFGPAAPSGEPSWVGFGCDISRKAWNNFRAVRGED